MVAKSNIYTDRQAAEKYLQVLLACPEAASTPVTWQVFDDSGSGLGAKHFHASLNDAWDDLCVLNRGGKGIFVTVNETDGTGRKQKNIIGVRAHFVDLDGAELPPFTLEPSILVESSPGRYHSYWRVNDGCLGEFRRLQDALAKRFHGDPAVKDLPRVMRVPGFYHQKGVPFMSRIISANSAIYTLDDLRTGLLGGNGSGGALPPACERAGSTAQGARGDKRSSIDELRGMLSFIPADNYETWIQMGMALHSEYPGEEGLNLWDEWSQTSEKWRPGETAEKWKGFGDRQTGSRLTVGTLVKQARTNGYLPPPKAKTRKTYREYIEFVRRLPSVQDIRRDIFTEELKIKVANGNWVPAENYLKVIESHAAEQAGFQPTMFERHLSRHAWEDCEPELLLDIPQWDGTDRLRAICEVLRSDLFSTDELHELLRYWMVGIFRRLKNPQIQQPTIILQGAQGLGKDTLIEALVGGLQSYVKELNITDREAEAQLHTGLVFKITEFDRSARTDVARLKNLLTTAKTSCRLSYDRRAQDRWIRASFVCTCNIQDILRDHTGNRRYWIINLTYAGFPLLESGQFDSRPAETYPGMFCRPEHKFERLQLLAHAKKLAESDACRPSDSTLNKMAVLIGRLTPKDPLQEAEEQWNEALTERYMRRDILDDLWVSNQQLKAFGLLEEIVRSTGISENRIKNMLNSKGYFLRKKEGRGYTFKLVTDEAISRHREYLRMKMIGQ